MEEQNIINHSNEKLVSIKSPQYKYNLSLLITYIIVILGTLIIKGGIGGFIIVTLAFLIISLKTKSEIKAKEQKNTPLQTKNGINTARFILDLIGFEFISSIIMLALVMPNHNRGEFDGLLQFVWLIFFQIIFFIISICIAFLIEDRIRINSEKKDILKRNMFYAFLTIIFYVIVFLFINQMNH